MDYQFSECGTIILFTKLIEEVSHEHTNFKSFKTVG